MWHAVDAASVAVVTSTSPRPVSKRHEQGRSYLASLVNYWLRRSELSHENLARIADWGCGEAGLLGASQVSHIRNRNLARGISARNLEGMAGANLAIWLWATKGEAGAKQRLGSHTSWKVESEWLDGAIWLPAPEHDTEPLTFGDFAELSVGLLTLPYLEQVALSPSEGVELSQRLSELLNALAGGGTPAEGIARVQKAYPITDPVRQRRLRDLLLGEHWTREELEEELFALAVAVNTLRCLPEGSYKPADLHAELSAHRRRT